MPGSPHTIVTSCRADQRVAHARAFLVDRGQAQQVLIVGASTNAANDLARRAGHDAGASFGWHRTSLGRLAGALAAHALAERGLTPVGALAAEALCARVVHLMREGPGMGRLDAVSEQPGLPRALARTLRETRAAGVRRADLARESPELAGVLEVYERELERAGLADRTRVLELAIDAAARGAGAHRWLGLPVLLLDVEVATAMERAFVEQVARASPVVLATVPEGDQRTRAHLEAALGTHARDAGAPGAGALHRTQAGLFGDVPVETGEPGDEVTVLSAPGESRECVELVRLVIDEAKRGVPFDRMAILLRAPGQYRAYLDEALRRAQIQAHFASGTLRPDPAGRAMLALLACAAEGLSARRFAEYLSLGEVPDATDEGTPPPAPPPEDRWVAPDPELTTFGRNEEPEPRDETERELERLADPTQSSESAPVVAGTLRAPRRWERLLVDAAVIGGRARWTRRLDGLARELELDREEQKDDEARLARIERDLEDLACLRGYAMPILDLLEALPAHARWAEWLERLSVLATRALRNPERVLAVLSELQPMSEVGPIELAEVRLVLSGRLTDLLARPVERKSGRVFVAPIDAARGLSFEVVFVPGLAERMFPQKVSEDPLLPDAGRERLSRDLETNTDRVLGERLALRLAVGAAERRAVLSYPRIDVDQSRPRVPSFYALEVLRAAEGRLPGFDELARRAEARVSARIGWPAPAEAKDAIDEAEHDLALLERVLHRPEAEIVGTARYLLSANVHLARALRFRARRWIRRWTPADGLIEPVAPAKEALQTHALSARSYSPTALEKFAACPYQFFLHAVHRLSPRETSEAIEELDPLQRGSLIHQVQFELLAELRAAGLLPITAENLPEARAHLDRVTQRVAEHFEDQLSPAIARVWDDSITTIQADLREWLRRASLEEVWTPWRFELSFGLVERRRDRDPASSDEPVHLDCGIRLRGSIDLVERSAKGHVRATDHKTGRVRAQAGAVIGGGATLQPVLYALALEKLLPGTTVESGRLYYCTQTGEFEAVTIPLDHYARANAELVAKTIGEAIETAFFPAAPRKGACEYCNFRPVCGPNEELRVGRVKRQDSLVALGKLREAK